MGGVAAHAAARLVDAQPWPAVSPDHTNETERRSLGAVRKRPTVGSPTIVGEARPGNGRGRKMVLSGRQVFDQRLGGEVALRQGVDEQAARIPEAVVVATSTSMRRGGRRAPHDAGVARYVARLNTVGDLRPVGGAAQIGPCDAATAVSALEAPAMARKRRRLACGTGAGRSAWMRSLRRLMMRVLVPRTRSSHDFAAGTVANFGFKSGTRS